MGIIFAIFRLLGKTPSKYQKEFSAFVNAIDFDDTQQTV